MEGKLKFYFYLRVSNNPVQQSKDYIIVNLLFVKYYFLIFKK